MNFAKSERAAICDALEGAGPDAPTLCGDWTAHDLAAHLWIRETDPLGAPGIVAKPLAGLTERRMNEIKARWRFSELVDRVRHGPTRLSVFAIPGVDEEANTVEFFIHHEDVRRAGPTPAGPRELPGDVEDWMWRRMKLMGRAMFRRVEVGVVLERERPADAAGEPDTVRVMAGGEIVTLIGVPSELMMYAHGRQAHSHVRAVGDAAALARLTATDLSR